MNYDGIVKGLNLEDYSGDELDDFGRRLCRQLYLHIGMIKYAKSKLKTFDLTTRNLSDLTDVAGVVVMGVDTITGLKEYAEQLYLFIGLVGALKVGEGTASVAKDLRNSIKNEMRTFISVSHNTGGYFWK